MPHYTLTLSGREALAAALAILAAGFLLCHLADKARAEQQDAPIAGKRDAQS